MNREIGKLTTTYEATYQPQSLIPGYTGHIPNSKFGVAKTFGNYSIKYFEGKRFDELGTSNAVFTKQFLPTRYTSQPDLAWNRRDHDRQQRLHAVTFIQQPREKEIENEYLLSQAYRNQYRHVDRLEKLDSIRSNNIIESQMKTGNRTVIQPNLLIE
ncbi:hypothetical protein SNEBB_002211 [Seison nebaliae]|nr:hypothetical protein SNEBB_002211 [Seison nebaliae]